MTAVTSSLPGRTRWIHGPWTDVLVACSWIPFSLGVLAVRGTPGAVATLAAGVLLFSLAHQPLTLGLVYGDPRQFAVKPRTFLIAPFVLAGLIWVGSTVSVALVGIVGAFWNAQHTLMQRYGLTRIYGRKGGDDHGPLEKPMLVSWLVAVMVWAGADARTPDVLAEVGLGPSMTTGVESLLVLRPVMTVLLLPALAAVAWTTTRWVRAERALGADANPAKHLYVGLTAVLFVVIAVDPLAGFIGYVGAHAFEYFVTIHQTLRTRYVEPRDPSPVGRAVSSRLGRAGAIAVFLMVMAAVLWLLMTRAPGQVYVTAVLTVGAMHIYFDGFIWKLRRPEVAASFRVH